MTAAPMVDRCFRHQHPECYGGPESLAPSGGELRPVVDVPHASRLRDQVIPGPGLAEEPMGWRVMES